VAAFRSKAVKKGDYYLLNGTKTFITNGGVADIVSVYALTDPAKGGAQRLQCVRRGEGNERILGGETRGQAGNPLFGNGGTDFRGLPGPGRKLLAGEGMGFAIMMKTLDFSRPAVGPRLWDRRGAFEYALNYARERVAFGKPIIAQQGISFKLADMAMNIEAPASFSTRTASVLQELPKDMSRISPETIRLSSMSKCFCADTAMRVTVEAVQVLRRVRVRQGVSRGTLHAATPRLTQILRRDERDSTGGDYVYLLTRRVGIIGRWERRRPILFHPNPPLGAQEAG